MFPAKTEISCRSCQPALGEWRPRERMVLLKLTTDPIHSLEATGSRGEVPGALGSPSSSGEHQESRDAPESRRRRSTLDVFRSNDLSKVHNRGGPPSSISTEARPRRRGRRSTSSSQGSESRAPRAELRWNKDERKTSGSRQEELKLTSSTFALTGDSAHNQAMVHWSGQNSSVSYIQIAFQHSLLVLNDTQSVHNLCYMRAWEMCRRVLQQCILYEGPGVPTSGSLGVLWVVVKDAETQSTPLLFLSRVTQQPEQVDASLSPPRHFEASFWSAFMLTSPKIAPSYIRWHIFGQNAPPSHLVPCP